MVKYILICYNLAIWQGNCEIVKYLVEKGANINAKNNEGDTLLMIGM